MKTRHENYFIHFVLFFRDNKNTKKKKTQTKNKTDKKQKALLDCLSTLYIADYFKSFIKAMEIT